MMANGRRVVLDDGTKLGKTKNTSSLSMSIAQAIEIVRSAVVRDVATLAGPDKTSIAAAAIEIKLHLRNVAEVLLNDADSVEGLVVDAIRRGQIDATTGGHVADWLVGQSQLIDHEAFNKGGQQSDDRRVLFNYRIR